MLTFKKSNWIYRYNDWCRGNMLTIDSVNYSKSLCSYFWGSFWNIIVVNTVYLVLLTFIGLATGTGLEETFLNPIFFGLESGLFKFILSVVYGWITITIILGMIITVIVGIGKCILMYMEYKKEHRTEKEPNIVIEYIKAKKSKICPMIKWED